MVAPVAQTLRVNPQTVRNWIGHQQWRAVHRRRGGENLVGSVGRVIEQRHFCQRGSDPGPSPP
jgi:hypothetical protein